MNNSHMHLSALLKTIQRGQVEIRSLLDSAMQPQLRSTLENQLQEYDSIETEVFTIALQRGWDLTEMDAVLRFITDKMTRMKISGRNTDSRIADILIQMNTKGMIRCLQERSRFPEKDPQIRILSQKLLDCEKANIRKMQSYL